MAGRAPLKGAYHTDTPFTIRIYKDGLRIVFVDKQVPSTHIYETIHFPWYMKWMIIQDINNFKGNFPAGMFKIEKCQDKISLSE